MAQGLTYASTPRRFAAYIVNSLLLGILVLGLAALFTAAASGTRASTLVANLLGDGLVLGYFVVGWTAGGTPGMRLMSLQIGGPDGTRLSVQQATIRWVAMGHPLGVLQSFVPSLLLPIELAVLTLSIVLLATVVASPTKQGLHDRAAGSILVQPIGASSGAITAVVVIVGGLLAILAISVIALIFLGGQVSRILSDVGRSI